MRALAMDFGSSAGRAILGKFDGGKLQIAEISRFKNYFVDVRGTYYWDTLHMYHQLKLALQAAKEAEGGVDSVGIDAWGTDYGLVDKRGRLLGNARCMRKAEGTGLREILARYSSAELFARTGVQPIYGGTLPQLYERLLEDDPALLHAHKMLFLPDLFTSFLTGELYGEYTMATTSMMFHPTKKSWDMELIRGLGISTNILPEVIYPGSMRLAVLPAVRDEVGLPGLTCIPVGSHDTASAVAAIPLEEGDFFCSNGTWSVVGTEVSAPVLTLQAQVRGLCNEGIANGKIRLLKNMLGMWVLQQCVLDWAARGQVFSWKDMEQMAERAAPFRSFIFSDDAALQCAGDMVSKIQAYCRRTGQPAPQTPGEIARCVYESMAMRYKMAIEDLCAVSGRKCAALRMVGGGSHCGLLNQFTANAVHAPVYAGPAEAASVGNILSQLIAAGELAGWEELREVVRRSFIPGEYLPEDVPAWADAYGRYRKIVDKRQG